MFVVLKKIYLVLMVATCVVGVVLPIVTALALDDMKKEVIAIDPGHGGYDGGVKGVVSGVEEATVNLAVAKLLKAYFESDGYKVVMTRSEDVLSSVSRKQEDMRARVKLINGSKSKLLVSLHVNYYSSSSRRGIQVFYNKEKDVPLAECLQTALNRMNASETGRNFSALAGDYYILANSDCPAALVECGFFSNPQDEELLLDENYRMRLAYEMFSAIKTSYLCK